MGKCSVVYRVNRVIDTDYQGETVQLFIPVAEFDREKEADKHIRKLIGVKRIGVVVDFTITKVYTSYVD